MIYDFFLRYKFSLSHVTKLLAAIIRSGGTVYHFNSCGNRRENTVTIRHPHQVGMAECMNNLPEIAMTKDDDKYTVSYTQSDTSKDLLETIEWLKIANSLFEVPVTYQLIFSKIFNAPFDVSGLLEICFFSFGKNVIFFLHYVFCSLYCPVRQKLL